MHAACAFIASIENEKGVRVEPPPAGHPYYRAFVPNEKFRQRADRPSQPLELHLAAPGQPGLGILTRIQESYGEGADQPTLTTQDIPIASPDELRKALRAETEGARVVFVYAPGSMLYGDLRRLAQIILESHPTLYVYAE